MVLSTTNPHGRANVMAMSWHMMVDCELPLVAWIVSAGDHNSAALLATTECVIAVPSLKCTMAFLIMHNRTVPQFSPR